MSENNGKETPFAGLERMFHEPNRLAILSSLCASSNGLTFGELKKECDLTDGNLSRHLKTLEDARIVVVRKGFVGRRPQTRIRFSDAGRERFVRYLQTLEKVLKRAESALAPAASRQADWWDLGMELDESGIRP